RKQLVLAIRAVQQAALRGRRAGPLRASISKFGFTAPVLIDETNHIDVRTACSPVTRCHRRMLIKTEKYPPPLRKERCSGEILPTETKSMGLLWGKTRVATQTFDFCWQTRTTWRRERDSNPRYTFLGVCSLSRGVPSTTRPSLRSSEILPARTPRG